MGMAFSPKRILVKCEKHLLIIELHLFLKAWKTFLLVFPCKLLFLQLSWHNPSFSKPKEMVGTRLQISIHFSSTQPTLMFRERIKLIINEKVPNCLIENIANQVLFQSHLSNSALNLPLMHCSESCDCKIN